MLSAHNNSYRFSTIATSWMTNPIRFSSGVTLANGASSVFFMCCSLGQQTSCFIQSGNPKKNSHTCKVLFKKNKNLFLVHVVSYTWICHKLIDFFENQKHLASQQQFTSLLAKPCKKTCGHFASPSYVFSTTGSLGDLFTLSCFSSCSQILCLAMSCSQLVHQLLICM